VETKIFIGQNDHIIYGCDLKRGDGMVAKIIVTEFSLLKEVPDALFVLPAGLSEINCTNANQYAQITLDKIKAQAKTPKFKEMKEDFQKTNRKKHYVVFILMFIPTFIFVWFLLRGKFKQFRA
jgi:hypothetical protein